MLVKDTIIDIQATNNSRIHEVDFNNIPFGRVFSDHMFVMDYKDGAWHDPQIIEFRNISMHPAASVIHYGQSIFEGMKAFKNPNGEIFLFRPEMNAQRFNDSAKRMCMPEVNTELFVEAIHELVKLDRNWISDAPGSSLYIRPYMFATDEYIGVKPSETYRMMIFTCPVNAYYTGAVKVKVETHYTRSVPGGTGFAKAAGNYAASLYPAKLAQEEGYHQLLWTDSQEHKWIEESGTMNVVFRIGDTLISPKPSETILDGITRDSVLQLAKDWGYKVEYRKISTDEIKEAYENGLLREAFGSGTAATIAPIEMIGFDDMQCTLTPFESWDFAPKALAEMDAIKRGLQPDPHKWNLQII
jgi:branched-chain amino acid aminotransferase